MTVLLSLTPELENYINEKVSSGAYSSADELVGDSLRLLKAQEAAQENLTETDREYLRREIQKGIDCFARGEYTVLDTSESAAAQAQKIVMESKRRWDEKAKGIK